MRSRASAGCADAHELGQAAQTSLRHRHRALPELRRCLEDHRRDRRSAGDCQNPQPSRPAHPRPAALASAAIRFIPDNLRTKTRLPTLADGAARSEFVRAARSGTFRAPPTAARPKRTEATLGFTSNRKGIDNSPVWRYSSGQKKRWFKFPIHPLQPTSFMDFRISGEKGSKWQSTRAEILCLRWMSRSLLPLCGI